MEAGAKTLPSNAQIAHVLEMLSELYAAKGTPRIETRAYAAAAARVRGCDRNVAVLARAVGPRRLSALLAIGGAAASVVCEYIAKESPGLSSPVVARSSYLETVRDARREPPGAPVSLLLEVDREYRRQAREGVLPRIAPRLFNPYGEKWLPILEVERDGCSFTAAFSNTARAHRLAKTRDWVVLRYVLDGEEHRCTVVTARHGELAGLRVVRGRERACRRYYADRHPRKAASAHERPAA